MKRYKNMYVSSFSDENFYIEKFEIGADAYRESFDGEIERLRVISIVSVNKYANQDEIMDSWSIDDCDYDIVFNHNNIKYIVKFESDGEIDELPEIIDLIYC